jgi:RNA polymerase sigma factor (sigma-70 family)
MIEDCELLRNYADHGDETAFATLVARKVNIVYSAALRQTGNDAQLAQEVTQGVFLDLARKARSLSRHTSLTGWLHTSTRFAAAKAVRTQQRWQNRTRDAQAMHEIENSASDEPAWNQLRPVLDAALAELGERDREALLLRFFEECPLAEVGSKIGLSENSARMCVDRALEKLRLTLARRGVTSTAAALGLVLAQHAVTAAPAGLAAAATKSALAAAAGSVLTASTAGAKIFEIMAMTKLQAGVAAAIGIAAATAFFFERQENEQLRAENTDVHREVAALRRENQRLARVATTTQSAPTEASPSRTPRGAGFGGSHGKLMFSHAAEAAPIALKVDEKEMERLMDIQRKGQLDARYGALFRRLNLSTEKTEQLKKLLLDRQNVARDVLHAGREQGLGLQEMQANLPAMIEKTNAAVDETIRRLLGDESYAQYQNYQSTLPQRAIAEQLASRLNSTDDPLSSQQLEQLVQTLAANTTPTNPTSPSSVPPGVVGDHVFLGNAEFGANSTGPVFAFGATGMENNSPMSTDAIAQSASFLSPTQLAALQQIQAEQQAAQALSQRLMSSLPAKLHELPKPE